MRRTVSNASLVSSTRPFVTTASRRTGLADGIGDPGVELGREARPAAVNEVEEELTVPLRSREPGVYDAGRLALPLERRLGDRPQHATSNAGVADDAAAADVRPSGLELRLHEHERLPAGSG